jgi:prephenate dehydrogenase
MDILSTNRANVLAAIARMKETLNGLESALRESESEQELAEALSKARERYQALVGRRD